MIGRENQKCGTIVVVVPMVMIENCCVKFGSNNCVKLLLLLLFPTVVL